MSIRRRLLLYLLICAPLVWAVALWLSVHSAREEVDELFDSELIRLARQVQVTMGKAADATKAVSPEHAGEADARDLALAVWDAAGRLQMADREGASIPYRADAAGFENMTLDGEAWRVYYLQSVRGDWLVASAQKVYEREELVFGLTASPFGPWLAVLPVLLMAMGWAIRQALAPLDRLSAELGARPPEDLRPLPYGSAPRELHPLLASMNSMLQRIDGLLQRERRFTADAAHELRTPLAVLRAQWDVLRRADSPEEREHAVARLGSGLDRMDRLVTQMLALARLESVTPSPLQEAVNWKTLAQQVFSDLLPLAERRGVELACDWLVDADAAMPLGGDPPLLAIMLRNLLDNAVRHGPVGGTVRLVLDRHAIMVDNEGPALPASQVARLGERFYRPDGQAEPGSGLGVSIVQRVASLHALALSYGPRPDGRGVRATLRRLA